MYDFTELINRYAFFTLETLKKTNEETVDTLQTSAIISLIKTTDF